MSNNNMESNPTLKQGLKYNPPVYFWLAEYNNGKALPQYNPYTGEENKWDAIDQSKLVKFSLYPFNTKLAAILYKKGFLVKVKSLQPYHLILNPDERLIYLRRQFINPFTYRICLNCNHKFMARKGITEVVKEVVEVEGKKDSVYTSYKCPKCGKYNAYICPKCNKQVNKEYATEEDKSKPVEERKHKYRCPRCDIEYPRYIQRRSSVHKYTKYLLGWQRTVNGINVKSIMYIDENGMVEMRSDDI